VNFANSADPNNPDLPTWPATSAADDAMIEFASEISVLKDHRTAQINLMDKIVERAGQ
jgi:carboxylesterase type B